VQHSIKLQCPNREGGARGKGSTRYEPMTNKGSGDECITLDVFYICYVSLYNESIHEFYIKKNIKKTYETYQAL
jgi:hypothetical protein